MPNIRTCNRLYRYIPTEFSKNSKFRITRIGGKIPKREKEGGSPHQAGRLRPLAIEASRTSLLRPLGLKRYRSGRQGPKAFFPKSKLVQQSFYRLLLDLCTRIQFWSACGRDALWGPLKLSGAGGINVAGLGCGGNRVPCTRWSGCLTGIDS